MLNFVVIERTFQTLIDIVKDGKVDHAIIEKLVSELEELEKSYPVELKYLLNFYLSLLYIILGNYSKAEECLKKVLKLAENDLNLLCRAYMNFVWLYMMMGDFKKAEDFAKKALKIAEELKNEFLIKKAKNLLERIRKD